MDTGYSIGLHGVSLASKVLCGMLYGFAWFIGCLEMRTCCLRIPMTLRHKLSVVLCLQVFLEDPGSKRIAGAMEPVNRANEFGRQDS